MHHFLAAVVGVANSYEGAAEDVVPRAKRHTKGTQAVPSQSLGAATFTAVAHAADLERGRRARAITGCVRLIVAKVGAAYPDEGATEDFTLYVQWHIGGTKVEASQTTAAASLHFVDRAVALKAGLTERELMPHTHRFIGAMVGVADSFALVVYLRRSRGEPWCRPGSCNRLQATASGLPPPGNRLRATASGQPPPGNRLRATASGQPPPGNRLRAPPPGASGRWCGPGGEPTVHSRRLGVPCPAGYGSPVKGAAACAPSDEPPALAARAGA